MKKSIIIISILLAGYVLPAGAVNKSVVIQSALVPGMGQMSVGGKHKYIGLGFLCAEIYCIHAAFNAMGNASSLQRNTALYEDKFREVDDYDEMIRIHTEWTNAYNDAKDSKARAMLWLGAAGGVWLVNVLEAVLFMPEAEEFSLQKKKGTSVPVSLSASPDRINVEVTKSF